MPHTHALRTVLLTFCLSSIGLSGCGKHPNSPEALLGDPSQGALVISRTGCGSCHLIPGIANADGMVGPSLAGFARRTTVAGMLPNTPDNLVRWVRFPQAVVPGNAMPNMGLSEAEARDVAAYLRTLR